MIKNVVLVIGLLVLAGCGGNDAGEGSDAGLSGSVRLDGSSTVFPISEAAAEEYLAVQEVVHGGHRNSESSHYQFRSTSKRYPMSQRYSSQAQTHIDRLGRHSRLIGSCCFAHPTKR